MTVKEFLEKMQISSVTDSSGYDREVSGMYIGDLLSIVMSKAFNKNAWITVHTNINTIAVAVLDELPCIIIPEGIVPETVTINKAIQENIAIGTSALDAFTLACRAYEIFKEEEGKA